MKKVLLVTSLVFIMNVVTAQQKWFVKFTDSAELISNAKSITAKFVKDVKKINPSIQFEINPILNTTPYLIFYNNENNEKTANLPIWQQVIEPQKQFFYEIAGSQPEGERIFGLFFNGFYLPHELGHALQEITEGRVKNSFESEYLANTIAILWWRKNKNKAELEQCYKAAKIIWAKLPNPVPSDSIIEEYFTANYEKASANPYEYGYMQFKQFISIYEDKNLPSFDVFIKKYFKKMLKKQSN